MSLKMIFIGSIGTLAETSELQRQAYNTALDESGVDWHWTTRTYRELLKSNGGKKRLQMLSNATNNNLSQEDIDRIHERKTKLAGELISQKDVEPREGLLDIIKAAQNENLQLAWVTTTGRENTEAILKSFDGAISESEFEHIFHRTDAGKGKPHPDIYEKALKHFKIDASEAISFEDSLNSALSAKSAGIFTVVVPGEYHDHPPRSIFDMVLSSYSEANWSAIKKEYERTMDSILT